MKKNRPSFIANYKELMDEDKCTYTQHSSFFQYGKMKFAKDLYAPIHLKSESLAVYTGSDVLLSFGVHDGIPDAQKILTRKY